MSSKTLPVKKQASQSQVIIDSVAYFIVVSSVFYVVCTSMPGTTAPTQATTTKEAAAVASVSGSTAKATGERGSWFGVQKRTNTAVGPKIVPVAQPEVVKKVEAAPEKPASVWEMFIDTEESAPIVKQVVADTKVGNKIFVDTGDNKVQKAAVKSGNVKEENEPSYWSIFAGDDYDLSSKHSRPSKVNVPGKKAPTKFWGLFEQVEEAPLRKRKAVRSRKESEPEDIILEDQDTFFAKSSKLVGKAASDKRNQIKGTYQYEADIEDEKEFLFAGPRKNSALKHRKQELSDEDIDEEFFLRRPSKAGNRVISKRDNLLARENQEEQYKVDDEYSFIASPRQVQQQPRDKNIYREDDYQEEHEDESSFLSSPRDAYRRYDNSAKKSFKRYSGDNPSFFATPKLSKSAIKPGTDNGGLKSDDFFAGPRNIVKDTESKKVNNPKARDSFLKFDEPYVKKVNVPKYERNVLSILKDLLPGSALYSENDIKPEEPHSENKFESNSTPEKLVASNAESYRSLVQKLHNLAIAYETLDAMDDPTLQDVEKTLLEVMIESPITPNEGYVHYRPQNAERTQEATSGLEPHETSRQRLHTAKHGTGDSFFAGESESWLASDSPRSKHTAPKYGNSRPPETYGQHKHTAKHSGGDSFLAGESESWLAKALPRSKQAEKSKQYRNSGGNEPSDDSWFAGETESWLASDKPSQRSENVKKYQHQQERPSHYVKPVKRQASGDSWLANSNHESEFFAAPLRNSNQAHHHAAPTPNAVLASSFFASGNDAKDTILAEEDAFGFLAHQTPTTKKHSGEGKSFKPKLFNPQSAPNGGEELTQTVKAAISGLRYLVNSIHSFQISPQVYSGRGAEGQQEYRQAKRETIDNAREFLQLFV